MNLADAGSLLARWVPLAGTDVAVRWNGLYFFLLSVSAIFFVGIVGFMLYFLVRFKHRPGVKTLYVTGNDLLEAIFIAIPTVLLLFTFVWGYSVYKKMVQAPANAYEIRVIAKQWLWNFQYENGRSTTAELYVPINRPVKLIMTSEDVLHSFFVPNFRVKQDLVPGMYSSIWFTATVPGKHQVFCAEYCGTSHSQMLAQVIVLKPEQWEAWSRGKKIGDIPDAREDFILGSEDVPSRDNDQNSEPTPHLARLVSLAEQGKSVYETKGCRSCHSVDGSPSIGPTHKGLFGRKEALLDGSYAFADENFIRKHIENPRGSLLKGYEPVMPTFQGLISETEYNELLAYLKSLK